MPPDSVKFFKEGVNSTIGIKHDLLSSSSELLFSFDKSTLQNIGISIGSFLLAFLFHKYLEKRKLLSTLKKRQQYLKVWVDLIGKPVRAQVESLLVYSKAVLDINSVIIEVSRYNLFGDRIEIVSPIETLNLYVTNKKGNIETNTQLLFALESNVSILKVFKGELDEILQTTTDSLTIIGKTRDSEVQKVHRLMVPLVAEINQGRENRNHIRQILDYYKAWMQSSKSSDDKVEMFKLFIEPVERICQSHVIEGDFFITEMLFAVQAIKFQMIREREVRNSASNQCKSLAELLTDAIGEIEKATASLSSQNFKNIFFLDEHN